MRLLALETNVEKLKKQFIADGEEELFSTAKHIFSFLIPMLGVVPTTLAVIVAGIVIIDLTIIDAFVIVLLVYAWLFIALYLTVNAFIVWRFNYLFVTTEKIVIVHHHFFFNQKIHPIHLDNIASINTASQFLGIGHCGVLHINLKERKEGSSGVIIIPYLPTPDIIAGVIENAIVLKKQRVPVDQGPEDQQQKIQDVKDKTVEEIKQS